MRVIITGLLESVYIFPGLMDTYARYAVNSEPIYLNAVLYEFFVHMHSWGPSTKMGQATVNPEKTQSAVVASLPTIVLRCRLIVPIPSMHFWRPSSINHVPVILIVTATCHRQSSLDVLSLVEYTSVRANQPFKRPVCEKNTNWFISTHH